ncbi:MAG: DnaT-like ssDNA-binding domain-containing protein, partial [Pseudomonadales bacterium]
MSSAPLNESGELRYAFNEDSLSTRHVSDHPTPAPKAGAMAPNWQPDDNALRLLAQQGVPNHFAHDQIAEFVHYWNERGEARHSWGNRFVSHVLRKWRDFEARQNHARKPETSAWEQPRENEPRPMTRDWGPSTDAIEILEIQAGIHRNFIEDAIPEFILYWSEKGDQCNTWNARFIS